MIKWILNDSYTHHIFCRGKVWILRYCPTLSRMSYVIVFFRWWQDVAYLYVQKSSICSKVFCDWWVGTPSHHCFVKLSAAQLPGTGEMDSCRSGFQLDRQSCSILSLPVWYSYRVLAQTLWKHNQFQWLWYKKWVN